MADRQEPSEYQRAVLKAARRGDHHLIIQSVAGSGKTWTLRKTVEYLPQHLSKLYLAFNRNVVDEMNAKYKAEGVSVKRLKLRISSINSYGHSEWIAYAASQGIKPRSLRVNEDKTYEIIGAIAGRDVRYSDYGKEVAELVRLGKTYGIVPLATAEELKLASFTEDKRRIWSRIARKHGVEFNDKLELRGAISLARKVLDISLRMIDVIDFDDQIYMPLVYGLTFKNRYDRVLADEIQDFSVLQREVVTRALKPTGKLIGVGDQNQSIYQFRGADSNSMNKIAEHFNAVKLPLSICYRCPTRVIQLAQRIVPEIQAAPNAPMGIVRRKGGLFYELEYKPGDMVLCRNNSPLIAVAALLREQGIPYKLLDGNKLSASISKVLGRLRTTNVREALKELKSWKAEALAEVRESDQGYAARCHINDVYSTIVRLAKKSKAQSVPQLALYVNFVLNQPPDPKKPVVTLGTIHRLKGDESPRVVFLDVDLIPSRYAQTAEELEQERHLLYIGLTRSKFELIFAFTSKEKAALNLSKILAGERQEVEEVEY